MCQLRSGFGVDKSGRKGLKQDNSHRKKAVRGSAEASASLCLLGRTQDRFLL